MAARSCNAPTIRREVVSKRLSTYELEDGSARRVLCGRAGLLVRIDSLKPIDDVTADVQHALDRSGRRAVVITMKSAREIEIMRRSGKITSSRAGQCCCRLREAGMTLREIDRLAEKGIRDRGGVPTFKGYHGYPGFPSACRSTKSSCTAFPGDQVLKDGDILSIDIGTTFENYVSDTARDGRDRQRLARSAAPVARHPGSV